MSSPGFTNVLIFSICICSTPCLDDVGNYITVNAGYSEDEKRKKFCGSAPYKKLYVFFSYTYIKFHTNFEVNSERLNGFSRIEVTTKGIHIMILILIKSNYYRHQ